jgi:predicted phage baseplate assembly protein
VTDFAPCRAPAPPTVGRAANEPGRDQLAYRVGDHDRFLAALLATLSRQPELAALTSRSSDEPVVALLDAWATALDVLAFYQERVVNEGFLRTATERDSVLHLARAIGYELRPGVAATTWLAFEVIASPGTPDVFPMPAGTRAQSVPGPGELPQVFETVEALKTRPGWNAMPVAASAPHVPVAGDVALRLAGTDAALQPGDRLLVVAGGPSGWFDVRRVAALEVVDAVLADPLDREPLVAAHTLVVLDAPLTPLTLSVGLPAGTTSVHVLRQRAAIFGYNALDWSALPVSMRVGELNPYYGETIGATSAMKVIGETKLLVGASDRLVESIGGSATAQSKVLPGVYAGRSGTWADAAFTATTDTISLDQVYPKVVAGSWVVLERSAGTVARVVASVAELPVSDFGMSARVTRLKLSAGDVVGFSPRNASVLLQSEQLAFAEVPLPFELAGVDAVDLARPVDGLAAGRNVVVAGLDLGGEPASEVATLHAVLAPSRPGLGPRLLFERSLTGHYQRATVKVRANVAKATHGESRAEIVGSGAQRQAFQTFKLSQKPLTYARSTAPTGARSTLAVWVGGVRWQQVVSLHGAAADARVYVVRHADDGTVAITFGDGQTGARLPTGRDNVVATYRVGIGAAADLQRGRISLPLTRPLGLRDVVNAVPADGADDPETLERARVNAPLTVRTLGRIVSVADYADFARAFAGVGKSRADLLWEERQVIHLTIADAKGAVVGPGTELATTLQAAIDRARHVTVPVRIAGYAPVRLVFGARLVVASDRRFPDVAAAARAALVEHFSFARRDFAQPIVQSEALALLQAVDGVQAVLLREFRSQGDASGTRREVVAARPARRQGASTAPAELLTVSAPDVDLQEAT